MVGYALGMIETRGLVASIEAADVMLKTAHITLLGKEIVAEGLVTIHVAGEVAAVTAAVDAARTAVPRVGELIGAHVIPKPAEEIAPLLKPPESRPDHSPSRARPRRTQARTQAPPPPQQTAEDELEGLTVHQLRTLARQTGGLGIVGREISRAGKTDLIRELRRTRQAQ